MSKKISMFFGLVAILLLSGCGNNLQDSELSLSFDESCRIDFNETHWALFEQPCEENILSWQRMRNASINGEYYETEQ